MQGRDTDTSSQEKRERERERESERERERDNEMIKDLWREKDTQIIKLIVNISLINSLRSIQLSAK